jgi:hypothetical protein
MSKLYLPIVLINRIISVLLYFYLKKDALFAYKEQGKKRQIQKVIIPHWKYMLLNMHQTFNDA